MSDFPMYGRGPEWIPVRQSPALQGEGYRIFMVSRKEPDRMAVAYLRAGRTWFYDAAGTHPLDWEPQWFGEAPCWPPLPPPPGYDESRVGWRKTHEPDAFVQVPLAIAGAPTMAGTLFVADDLRRLADDKTLFFDEARKALIYRGPMPPKET